MYNSLNIGVDHWRLILHSPQRSADSAVDCVNAEIFHSWTCTRWMSPNALFVRAKKFCNIGPRSCLAKFQALLRGVQRILEHRIATALAGQPALGLRSWTLLLAGEAVRAAFLVKFEAVSEQLTVARLLEVGEVVAEAGPLTLLPALVLVVDQRPHDLEALLALANGEARCVLWRVNRRRGHH